MSNILDAALKLYVENEIAKRPANKFDAVIERVATQSLTRLCREAGFSDSNTEKVISQVLLPFIDLVKQDLGKTNE